MAIDGIQPTFNPTPKYKKTNAVEAQPSKVQVPRVKKADKFQSGESKKIDGAQNPAKQDKISRSVTELQALTDKIRASNQETQLRADVQNVEKSLIQAKQELSYAASDRTKYATEVTNEGIGKSSYWERLELAEKMQKINHLKEAVRSLEIERYQYVQILRERVSQGTYQVSSSEILQGIINELF